MVRASRRYAVTALERGLAVLQVIAGSDRALALHEITARTRMPKTTAFRLLATLEGQGYVVKTRNGEYGPSMRAIQLSPRATHGEEVLREAARPVLQRLHHLSGDTVNLAVWRHRQVAYIEVLPSGRPLRFVEMPGAVAPLHATALGKAVAAYLPEDEVLAILSDTGMPRFTRNTITSPSSFLRVLRRVRARGFAADREEKDVGAGCVAAPLFDGYGVVGAISVSAPTSLGETRSLARIVPSLIEGCGIVSRQLGFRPATAMRTERHGVPQGRPALGPHP